MESATKDVLRVSLLLVVGAALLLFAFVGGFQDVGERRVVVALGVVYVTSGLLLSAVATWRGPEGVSFRPVVAIAVVAATLVVCHRLWVLYSLGRLDSPRSGYFWNQLVLAASSASIGVVTAALLPAAFARTSRHWAVVLLLGGFPVLVGTVVSLLRPPAWGAWFGILIVLVYAAIGAFAGLPLWAVARSLAAPE